MESCGQLLGLKPPLGDWCWVESMKFCTVATNHFEIESDIFTNTY